MAIDIILSKNDQPIKNGSLVLATSITGFFQTQNSYVNNLPVIADIQSKYDNRFDNPSYYYGGGGVDGGDV